MKGKEITRELRKNGGSVKEISNFLGIKPPTVSQVIHNIRPNPKIRQAIAKVIGRPVEEIWPPSF